MHCVCSITVIPEIFASLIFARLIIVVIYYLWFQVAVKLHCSKALLQLSFQAFNFRGFLQLQIIINNREDFQN